MTDVPVQVLAERLRDACEALGREGEGSLASLAALYDPEVVFEDPLQKLVGREAFLAMNRRILRRAKRIAFDVKDVLAAGDSLCLTWSMTYEPHLGPTLVFEGATHARVRGGLVVEHRDYWDLLSSVARSVPVARDLYAALAPHLG